ncbi:MAG: type II toxin-antitoxin system VapC family toxin [Methylococcales bacterium]|nr:type II toxin-antitoxin system VapC family toxin [Methylococcales bacterium]
MAQKILLDTCTFLWLVRDDAALSTKARELILNTENAVFLSIVSVWEMTVKHGLGKLPLADLPHIYIPSERKKHDIESLPLIEEAVAQLGKLPSYHQDPFDRMLICQAIHHGCALLTPDHAISCYPVNTQW